MQRRKGQAAAPAPPVSADAGCPASGGRVSQANIRYAFTAFSGADRYAPFTTYRTVMVYDGCPQPAQRDLLPFKPVEFGANIKILSPYDIHYCLQHYPGGVDGVVEAMRPPSASMA